MVYHQIWVIRIREHAIGDTVESTDFIQEFMLEDTVGSTELSVLAMKAVKVLQMRVGWLARSNSSRAVEQFANGIPAY